MNTNDPSWMGHKKQGYKAPQVVSPDTMKILKTIEGRQEQAVCGLLPVPMGASKDPAVMAHKAINALVKNDVPFMIGKIKAQEAAGIKMADGATFAVNELGTLNNKLKGENEMLRKVIQGYMSSDVADLETAMIKFIESMGWVVKKRLPLGKKH